MTILEFGTESSRYPGLFARKREAPWIGIGASGTWTDYEDALDAAGLDFTVYREKVHCDLPVVPIAEIPGYGTLGYGSIVSTMPKEVPVFANVRDSDNKILGVVSQQYGIVQNHDAFSLLEPFTKAGGVITNAGMTEQGLCFMVLRMRQSVILGDEWDFDVMCTNSFNGAFPCSLIIVPMRIVCQNMYRKLMGRHDGMLHVRHGRFAEDRIVAAGSVTAQLLTFQAAFESQIQLLADKNMRTATIENAMLPILFPYPKEGTPKEAETKERINRMREQFMDIYYDASDNRKFHGTALGFVNAYYDYLSHREPIKRKSGKWEDRRLSGLVSGNDVNNKLLARCL